MVCSNPSTPYWLEVRIGEQAVNYHISSDFPDHAPLLEEAEFARANLLKAFPSMAASLTGKANVIEVMAPPKEWLEQNIELMKKEKSFLEERVKLLESLLSCESKKCCGGRCGSG